MGLLIGFVLAMLVAGALGAIGLPPVVSVLVALAAFIWVFSTAYPQPSRW